ncbi:cobalamin biosynthesis protein CobW [Staphylococcus pasteuri]|uniref:CobW family GTP-binding protein n=1 Tax=Staphylococcus pasteuri TaxID=45972 RepID=UPI000BC2E6E9|nr:GTP-binding protein [Staphylococcus pasteuri]ATH63303.1 cobalamin biosynthesis protein CobW [Staphylococcus pasteuri]
MKNNKSRKISISIISGFLGSGKTTLLTHYISELLKIDEKIKVIMNEFGSFDVDSQNLDSNIEVRSIINGCVCCDLKTDLINQIQSLIQKDDCNHIIIEATGVANPIEIFAACQDPTIVDNIDMPQIISVVDVERFLNRNDYTSSTQALMEEQLEMSDLLVINKMDCVDSEEINKIENEINKINPSAPHILTTYGKFDISQLRNQKDKTTKHHQHHHHHGIISMKYTFTSPIDRQLFYQFIMQLPKNVLRLKGYIKFRDNPNETIEFQYSYGLPDFGAIAKEMPLTIVIIGEHIDVNRLKNKLDMLQFT